MKQTLTQKRSVVDGMTDVIHNLALDAGIPPSGRTQTRRLRRACFTIRHWSPLFPASVRHLFVDGLLLAVMASNGSIYDS